MSTTGHGRVLAGVACWNHVADMSKFSCTVPPLVKSAFLLRPQATSNRRLTYWGTCTCNAACVAVFVNETPVRPDTAAGFGAPAALIVADLEIDEDAAVPLKSVEPVRFCFVGRITILSKYRDAANSLTSVAFPDARFPRLTLSVMFVLPL